MTLPIIRPAENTDIEAITAIYHPYVTQTTITFEETPPSVTEMQARYDNILDHDFPYLILELNNQVIGYGYIGPFHHRCAYRYSVEHSIYLDQNFLGKGYGSLLMDALINEAKSRKLKSLIAVIAGNEPHASHHLHEKHGFEHVGVMKNCGFKFDQWINITYMQKQLA